MTPTNVGMRCPECSKQRTRVVTMRNIATVPRVTYALIAINVLVFFTEQGQFTVSGSTIHGTVVNDAFLSRATISLSEQYYRLVTSAFIHENLLHIGFNMYLLYWLGLLLEPAIGSLRFGVVYATSLLAGSAGVLVATSGASIGASGAIFGLMGAALVEARGRGSQVVQSQIAFLIVINLIFSFTFPDISVGAHIGGLIGGTLAGLAFRYADRIGGRHTLSIGLGLNLLLCVVSVVISLAAATAWMTPGIV